MNQVSMTESGERAPKLEDHPISHNTLMPFVLNALNDGKLPAAIICCLQGQVA